MDGGPGPRACSHSTEPTLRLEKASEGSRCSSRSLVSRATAPFLDESLRSMIVRPRSLRSMELYMRQIQALADHARPSEKSHLPGLRPTSGGEACSLELLDSPDSP